MQYNSLTNKKWESKAVFFSILGKGKAATILYTEKLPIPQLTHKWSNRRSDIMHFIFRFPVSAHLCHLQECCVSETRMLGKKSKREEGESVWV